MGKMPIEKVWKPSASLPSAKGEGKKGIDRERLKKACSEFEALFIHQLLKFMRQAAPTNALLGNGPGTEIYQSLMDQELSNHLAKRGGIGLGEMMAQQILRREEAKSPSPQELKPFSPPETEVKERRKDHERIGGPSSYPLPDHGRGRLPLSLPDPED
jgi:Rod binding domain-containing protein